MNSRTALRPVRSRGTAVLIVTAGLLVATPAPANGLGENGGWQFQTQQDRVNKGAVLDMIERKKAGYYDAIRPVYNYTTYIDKQVNCNVTATTAGNTGSNATTATTSSPTVSSSGSTGSSAAANSASNSQTQAGRTDLVVSGTQPSYAGGVANDQLNNGSIDSNTSGNTTTSTTGPVTASGGTSDQVLNSQQTSSGTLTASVSGSTACVGPLNGN